MLAYIARGLSKKDRPDGGYQRENGGTALHASDGKAGHSRSVELAHLAIREDWWNPGGTTGPGSGEAGFMGHYQK